MANRSVVLVVEDEPGVLATLCYSFAHAGFGVLSAKTFDRALHFLNTEHVDAISLDIRLPDTKGQQRSGLTLLTFVRATGHVHLPVVVFTAFPLTDAEQAIIERQDAEVLYKPQPPSRLIQHLTLRLASRHHESSLGNKTSWSSD